MTDVQKTAIAALARTILEADVPYTVQRALFEGFERWPGVDRNIVLKIIYLEADCFAQQRSIQ
jgi:hypothetical protein